jgi:hypothetical protein
MVALIQRQRPRFLPRLSYLANAAGLAAYAAIIVVESAELRSDIRVLILALLALSVGLALLLRSAPLNIVEKAVLYVTATVLVYLDAMVLPPDHRMSVLTWIAVSIAALATAVRLRLQNDRRFQVTPLDLIVLFMALVVPSLPGTLHLPEGGALAIAKLLILLYSIEILVSRSEGAILWMRIAVIGVLAGLVVRPLMSF